MSQRYNGNTKRPKLKQKQLGTLKICAFCQKSQQRASGPGESAAGATYLSMRINSKSCSILPLKDAATLFCGSRNGADGVIVIVREFGGVFCLSEMRECWLLI